MPLDLAFLRERRPENQFHYFPVTGSTMVEAARLVHRGASHGAVVLAEEQTAGVGRLGRSWVSEPEVGIYASVLLRLPLPPARLPLASLVIGLAVADAIQRSTKLACDLRWPNDVLINDRKAAGILPQLVETCIVGGIGINVNTSRFPEGLRTPATSLLLESGGQLHSRENLIVALLGSLESFCDMLVTRGSEAILRAFSAASSYAVDRRVVVEETQLRGVTSGLDSNGFLLIRTDSGELHHVSSGGVRPDTGRPA